MDGPLSRDTVDEILGRLRARPPTTERELDRVYRRLLRETHPDRAQGDAETFLYVQSQVSEYRGQWMHAQAKQELNDAVDRVVLLRELGLAEDLAARPALLASLYRFRSLGLANYRVRSRPALKRRNAAVIRTVVAWAYEYDPAFVDIFHRFLVHHGNFGLAERHAALYFMVRRMVLRGLDGLIRYQDIGRKETAEIAADSIRYSLQITTREAQDPAFAALRGFATWILTELGQPATPIGLDA